MLIWMVYVIVVAILLSAAASCAERAARITRSASRWTWLVAIVAALLIPLVISFVSIRVPSLVPPTAVKRVVSMDGITSSMLSPLRWMSGRVGDPQSWRDLDSSLLRAWLAMSLILSAGLVVSAVYLRSRKRSWRSTTLDGIDVYVANDVGPAVVGLLHPRIVVPDWLLKAPHKHRTMVLAHERAHLEAGDQRLLTIALCLLVFMPWNVPLWWQLRRLRRAIEVDCDARVLRTGHNTAAYAETLIEVGQRRSSFVGAVAAMSEPTTFLEQRVQIMTRLPSRMWRMSAAVFALLALGIFAVAAQVSPPNAGSNPDTPQEISLPTSVLDRYVGSYSFGGSAVFKVTRKGQQLTSQLTGQPTVDIYPQSETSFFLKVVKATIDFVTDAQGPATELVLHQNGNEVHAPRIDDATAHQIETDIAAKVQSQTPTPGSEAALRRLIDGLTSGSPNYSEMSDALATATRQQLPTLQSALVNLGALQTVQFRAVGVQGWDVYDVRYEKGMVTFRIGLSADGKVAGALLQAGP